MAATITLLLAPPHHASAASHGKVHTQVSSTRASGALLRNDTGLYPRAIRLSHSGEANGMVVASVVGFDGGGGVGVIYRSADGGQSFHEVGAIHDRAAAGGLCCSSIFELPQQIGTMPAGTLLWSAAIGQNAPNRRMTVSIWTSPDHGVTWSFLSVCRVAGNSGGLWEPELSVNAEGDLVCHYADETEQPRHSQLLAEVFSSDGVRWSNPYHTVAVANAGLRPGMPVVRRLGNGSYYMTYEVCGTGNQYDCAAYYRTSADGANWGDPAGLGTMIRTESGQYFTHAPNLATAGGKLWVVGQQLREPSGAIAAGSGRTVLVNTHTGTGGWAMIGAPVVVPSPANNYCPNYSSSLLPSLDGGRLLEIATDYDGSICKPYYASGPA
ncbi:exo-alpha-sialidase [Amycolatopsis sp. H20-H5]|uniref:exo-alpha-sialidase n=1 Tax=Amycolatopsis sp. H20-H5 TaxID=3046309 RepID=UPI002DB6F75C|nr:exo-alpha-sialidase [Amycolatopsis sp. H20-H5]MEC3980459.1 exo-alpha-sialidase [Amycolatopsis sp. H20-H5]